MSVLWVAEHRHLKNEVVVKFLGDEMVGDASAAKRIAREAAAAASVKSPHVVQIFDHGVYDGTPYIVMELLEGRDLRAHLLARKQLSSHETILIAGQLAKALARVHATGIVHRDVKPSNVFLCDVDGEIFVKLLDFGLACRASDDSSSVASQLCAGTPPYMSPEQILADGVDARSDVWSFGALVFQCLTGQRPFAGETFGALALAVHTLPLPRLTDLRPDLPAEMDDWFARACARSVEDRFPSAFEATRELELALGAARSKTPFSHGLQSGEMHERTATEDFTLTRAPRAAMHRTPAAWIVSAGTIVLVFAAGAFHRGSSSPPAARGLDENKSTATARVAEATVGRPDEGPKAGPTAASAVAAPLEAASASPMEPAAPAGSAPREHPVSPRLPPSQRTSLRPMTLDHGGVQALELPDERR
jgi:serine/threonine protein kinase